METMLFGDEVVPPEDLDELPESDDVKARPREVEMAKELIESLASDFDPSKYRDEYRERVLELIEQKAEGHEIAIQPQEEAPPEVPDLMAALEASIASAKRQGGTARKAVDKQGADGAKPEAGKAKSKAAAKKPASTAKKRAPAKKRSTAKK
jgi:DNA end-binding protein Ku